MKKVKMLATAVGVVVSVFGAPTLIAISGAFRF